MASFVFNNITSELSQLKALGYKTGKVVPNGVYSEQFGAPSTDTGGGKISQENVLDVSAKLRPYVQIWNSGMKTLATPLQFHDAWALISINKVFSQENVFTVNWAPRTENFHTHLYKCHILLQTWDSATSQRRSYTLADGSYLTLSVYYDSTPAAGRYVLQIPVPPTVDQATQFDFYLMVMPGRQQGTETSLKLGAYLAVNQIVTSTETVEISIAMSEIPYMKEDGLAATPTGDDIPGCYPYPDTSGDPLGDYFLAKIFSSTHNYYHRPAARIEPGSWKNAIAWACDNRSAFDNALKQYWNEAVVTEMVRPATSDNDGVELQRVICKVEPALAFDVDEIAKIYGDSTELYPYHRVGGLYATASANTSLTANYLEGGFKLSYNPADPNSGTNENYLQAGIEVVIAAIDKGGSATMYQGGNQVAFFRTTVTGSQIDINGDPEFTDGTYLEYYVGGFGFSQDEVYIHEFRPVILGSENHNNDPASYLTAWRTAVKAALIRPDGTFQNDLVSSAAALDKAFPRVSVNVDFEDMLQPEANINTANYWGPATTLTEGQLYGINDIIGSHGNVEVINQITGQVQEGFEKIQNTVETVLDKVPPSIRTALAQKATDAATNLAAQGVQQLGNVFNLWQNQGIQKRSTFVPMQKYLNGTESAPATFFDGTYTYTFKSPGVRGRVSLNSASGDYVRKEQGPNCKFNDLKGIVTAGNVVEQNTVFNIHVVEDAMDKYNNTDETYGIKNYIIPPGFFQNIEEMNIVKDPFLEMFNLRVTP